MQDTDARSAIVLRIWGSFIVAVLLLSALGTIYEVVQGMPIGWASLFLSFGIFLAFPFLAVAGMAGFAFAGAIVRHPWLWSLAATLVATIGMRWWLEGTELVAFVVAVTASVVFCVRLARHPVTPVETSAPWRRPRKR